MTVEQKAKRYDEALERARALNNGEDVDVEAGTTTCEYIFPELAETEDEKIRKKLISFVENWDKGGIVSKYTSNANDIKRIFAWLEKQGEKPQGKSALEAIKEEKVDNANKVEPKDYSSIDPHFFKTTDKVEPKFHEGEWITDGNSVLHITNMDYGFYQFEDSYDAISIIDEKFHLWTIRDAKDGDILIYNDSIFIFDEIYENDLIYYGIYEHNKFHKDKYYSFLNLNTININIIYPATKEQRDTLEKAMTDAGYIFDFESKELKKLGQSEVTKMSDQEEIAEIPFGAKDSELQEATYFIPKGFHAEIDDDKVVIKKGEKPTAWSEEDMSKVQRICKYLNEAKKYYADITEVRECMDWLKSLKGRVGCEANCTTTKEWNESDKEEFQIAIDTLVKAGQHDSAHWLKSLKQRIGG